MESRVNKRMRIASIVLAAMMCTAVPAYAAAPTGAASEVKAVTVTNVEGAASVKAYKIVEATFDSASDSDSGGGSSVDSSASGAALGSVSSVGAAGTGSPRNLASNSASVVVSEI